MFCGLSQFLILVAVCRRKKYENRAWECFLSLTSRRRKHLINVFPLKKLESLLANR